MPKPYYEHGGQTIYHGDCREILPTLEPVDLVLTDPPYGVPHIDATWHKRKRNRQDGSAKAMRRDYGDLELPCPKPDLINAVKMAGRDAIIWGGNYFLLIPAGTKWLVWDKDNGRNDFADCELAWTTLRGAVRKFTWRWNGMLQQATGRNKEARYHPTQKPVPLMQWCIEQAPDDCFTILDPFMGSGTTLRAAKDLGRQAIGIEIEERYCEIAANRLRQEVLFTE